MVNHLYHIEYNNWGKKPHNPRKKHKTQTVSIKTIMITTVHKNWYSDSRWWINTLNKTRISHTLRCISWIHTIENISVSVSVSVFSNLNLTWKGMLYTTLHVILPYSMDCPDQNLYKNKDFSNWISIFSWCRWLVISNKTSCDTQQIFKVAIIIVILCCLQSNIAILWVQNRYFEMASVF